MPRSRKKGKPKHTPSGTSPQRVQIPRPPAHIVGSVDDVTHPVADPANGFPVDPFSSVVPLLWEYTDNHRPLALSERDDNAFSSRSESGQSNPNAVYLTSTMAGGSRGGNQRPLRGEGPTNSQAESETKVIDSPIGYDHGGIHDDSPPSSTPSLVSWSDEYSDDNDPESREWCTTNAKVLRSLSPANAGVLQRLAHLPVEYLSDCPDHILVTRLLAQLIVDDKKRNPILRHVFDSSLSETQRMSLNVSRAIEVNAIFQQVYVEKREGTRLLKVLLSLVGSIPFTPPNTSVFVAHLMTLLREIMVLQPDLKEIPIISIYESLLRMYPTLLPVYLVEGLTLARLRLATAVIITHVCEHLVNGCADGGLFDNRISVYLQGDPSYRHNLP